MTGNKSSHDDLNFSQSGFLTDLSDEGHGAKSKVVTARSGKTKPEDDSIIQIALDQEQKEKLEKQLAELQAKLASSNNNIDEVEKNELEKIREYRRM